MLKRGAKREFPLHLAPIDDFFCLDDRPDYPMTFTAQLFFTGEVDRDAFEPALLEALQRHPLLRALIKPAKSQKPCWVSAGGRLPRVNWGRLGEPYELEDGEAIDLSSEPGLRVWVRTSTDSSEMLLQFHHACSDGTGAYRFLGDLLAEYGLRTAGTNDRPVVELCDQTLLKTRRSKMAEEAVFGTRLGVTRRGLAQAFDIFRHKITPLATREHSQDSSSGLRHRSLPFPGIETFTFGREEYRQLRGAASQAGAMFNDLLLAEMFMAMRDWNGQFTKDTHRQRLRIMMPTDLREKEDILMPAANMTAYSFITRRSSACDQPEELLRGIRDETMQIKREKRGKQFMDSVMAGKHIPGLLGFLLNRERCLATVILSNVGDPSRRFLARFPRAGGRIVCGNLRLEHISGVPPLRPGSRATVSIVTYGRELAVHLRCDSHTMSSEDARAFLGLYAERLRSRIVQEPAERPRLAVFSPA